MMVGHETTATSSKDASVAIPRGEYPRPDLVRPAWLCLNGIWDFAFDDAGSGRAEEWFSGDGRPFDRQIVVPFPFEASLSGIGDASIHTQVWYRRRFTVPAEWRSEGQRVLLHFGAVDYRCQVWVQGILVGEHRGGYTPFSLDVTDVLAAGDEAEQTVVVWVEDTVNREQPRGKQYWERQSQSIWYTRTTGIWQSVWLEPVPATHVTSLTVQRDPSSGLISVAVDVSRPFDGVVVVTVRDATRGDVEGTAQGSDHAGGTGDSAIATSLDPRRSVPIPSGDHAGGRQGTRRQWSTVWRATVGCVRIEVRGNHGSVERRAPVSDVGAGSGLLSTRGSIPRPATMTCGWIWSGPRRLGFNGARKHQKVEDPRWLYWCDRLGFLVWGEMGNAHEYSAAAEEMFMHEWPAVVRRDRNHPCIVTWTPFNESWGIPGVLGDTAQQDYVRRVVALTHEIDPTRPVVDNDGWEHLEESDLCTIYDYSREGAMLRAHHEGFRAGDNTPGFPRAAYVEGQHYNGTPIMYTEYGGIALQPPRRRLATGGQHSRGGCGLGLRGDRERARGAAGAFRRRDGGVAGAPDIQGLCYTQLTDVEQEINGLLTYDRRPKVSPAEIVKALK